MSHLDDVMARQQPPNIADLEAENARLRAQVEQRRTDYEAEFEAKVRTEGEMQKWRKVAEAAEAELTRLRAALQTAEQEREKLLDDVAKLLRGRYDAEIQLTSILTARDHLVDQTQALRDEFYAALIIMRNYYAQAISRSAVEEVLDRGWKFIKQTDDQLTLLGGSGTAQAQDTK